MERAGEPLRSHIPSAANGIPRPAMGVKGSSIAALSSSNLVAPTPSRHAGASSFAKSVGPGARPPPTARAPTSMGFAQSTNVRPRGLTRTRPATSMAHRETDDEAGQRNQPKGMKIPPYSQLPRLRNAGSQQQAVSQTRQPSRDISGLSRRLQKLSLHDQPHDNSSGAQAVPNPSKQPLSRTSQSDVQTGSITPTKLPHEEAARSNPFGSAQSQRTLGAPPTTPLPQIKFNDAWEAVQSLLKSPCKRPCSPSKSSSPTKKVPYLTKDSNLTTFTGWDVDGRLNEFESQFKVMKEAFEGTVTDRKAMEEAIDLAKNRGMSSLRESSERNC